MCPDITYVEVDVEISRAAKFSVANLEGDCHFVVLVEFFVETFSGVRLQGDVVGEDGGEEGGGCHKGGGD
jgi:hypothetical protein